jgi:hypothetical protein
MTSYIVLFFCQFQQKHVSFGFRSQKPDLQPLVLTQKTIYPHNIGKYVNNVPGYYVGR